METQIAGSIARMDGSTSQDAIFKDVLAYKEVLAHIMKTCVPEYKDCTIPEIIGRTGKSASSSTSKPKASTTPAIPW